MCECVGAQQDCILNAYFTYTLLMLYSCFTDSLQALFESASGDKQAPLEAKALEAKALEAKAHFNTAITLYDLTQWHAAVTLLA